MRTPSRAWMCALVTTIALAGCVVADKSSEAAVKLPASASNPIAAAESPAPGDATAKTSGQAYRGWYVEHDGQGMLQACGQSQQWRVDSTELRAQAKEFGLEQDTPVYVRVFATPSADGSQLLVSRVDQFGSPTPVRDCSMTGVVIPPPTGA